jgi:uncharacterized membrane protein
MSILDKLFSPASFDIAGIKAEGPSILIIPLLVALAVFFVLSLIWIYKDSRKRNKSGFIALLFILLTGWPLSFLWWLWIRPRLKTENRSA